MKQNTEAEECSLCFFILQMLNAVTTHELVYARTTTPLTLSGKLPAIWERPLVVTLPNYRMLHTSLQLLLFIKSTVYCPAHFILLHILFFLIFFDLYLCIFSCVVLHILHCPLSGPDLIYISLLIMFCIIEYVTNKTLNPWVNKRPDKESLLRLNLYLQIILRCHHILFPENAMRVFTPLYIAY